MCICLRLGGTHLGRAREEDGHLVVRVVDQVGEVVGERVTHLIDGDEGHDGLEGTLQTKKSWCELYDIKKKKRKRGKYHDLALTGLTHTYTKLDTHMHTYMIE